MTALDFVGAFLGVVVGLAILAAIGLAVWSLYRAWTQDADFERRTLEARVQAENARLLLVAAKRNAKLAALKSGSVAE